MSKGIYKYIDVAEKHTASSIITESERHELNLKKDSQVAADEQIKTATMVLEGERKQAKLKAKEKLLPSQKIFFY